MAKLFVYGTLLFPEILKTLTGKTFRSASATLHKYRRYKVSGTDYPAITKQENAITEGRLLFDVDEKSMKKIELFEGDEYEIKTVSVISNSEIHEATVFAWKSNPAFLTQKDWNPSEFEKNNLKNYL